MTGRKPRYLTKSRFKTGHECPRKLVYLNNETYPNTKADDPFLKALADGGFQVGALAKLSYPREASVEVKTQDKDQALRETTELLKQKHIVIFEAAIKLDDCFIRVDILEKMGNSVKLIEVKAKSIAQDESFLGAKGGILAEWEPYLMDVAFQKFVFAHAFPEFTTTAHLMLANKDAVATVDGLNQRFFLEKIDGQTTQVRVAPGTDLNTIGHSVLAKIEVEREVEMIWQDTYPGGKSFAEYIQFLAAVWEGQINPRPVLSKTCKSCEFRCDPADLAAKRKSGFAECWQDTLGREHQDELFRRQMVFDLWQMRRADTLIEREKYLIADLTLKDLPLSSREGGDGLSTSERQWEQIKSIQEPHYERYFDQSAVRSLLKSFTPPFHFIDFETTRVAIPFNRGRRPYEQVAFQFSHHVLHPNGRIEHRTQYLNAQRGAFPNFEFVRNLKVALEGDSGTIFRYSHHENTVLCEIIEQLDNSNEPDRDALVEFLQSITKSKGLPNRLGWEGPRNMVDLCEIIKLYVYLPETQGSNSIKQVLPAILQRSDYLKTKYSQKCYGGSSDIPSLNHRDPVAWISVDETGQVSDPYTTLPPVFSDYTLARLEDRLADETLSDGGAAMTAYARMQFTEMSATEVELVRSALLRYCELDTMAMVMLFEFLREEVRLNLSRAQAG